MEPWETEAFLYSESGALTGTRTPIDRLGGDCSILLSYESAKDLYLIVEVNTSFLKYLKYFRCDITD